MKLRLFADKPCPKHKKLAFWIGSDIYCKTCLAEMNKEDRETLCKFWAELIISIARSNNKKEKDNAED
jgi:hypothetical protein